MDTTLSVLFNILLIAGGVFTLYAVYFCVIAFFGFKKNAVPPKTPAQTRFAMVVAARNEQAVIGQLVDSLNAQNYPREMYDIIVAPNNCTDNTRLVALRHGAKIFDPKGKITGKGEVLTQVVDMLLASGKYDAMCVFDADNLVHPDFLQKMNDARMAGAQVAQGFRDSKNPTDTAISTCYSVCYWMLNRFYNGGRQALRLSGLVNGSGFMVSTSLLQQLGGWHTCTMTEDYEFTAQCVMQGQRVWYVSEAVIYDEQPLTFFQSWKQRRRWSTGSVQGMELHLKELLRTGFAKRSWVCLDLAITFMTPAVQAASLLISFATTLVGAYQIFELHLLPATQVLITLTVAATLAFMICTALAAFVVKLNRSGGLRGAGWGALYFGLFLLSWMPIGIISLFKPQKTWDAIAHTRSLEVHQMR